MQLNAQKTTAFSALCRQISSPTLVTHSVFCNILHPKYKNLVLVRGTTIEIYEIKETKNDLGLSFVTSSMLYEEVEDIAVVRFYGHQMDSLLLSFKEAKVAAMTFDIQAYELKTCSLHTYEDLSLKGGRLQFTKTPMLRVDPLQRCAVMLVYDRYLAVLPFRRADALTSAEHLAETPTTPLVEAVWQHKATAPILSTFTTFLSTSTGERINNVIDIKFLYGFYEPTLFVLYEPIGTWAGRVSARRDTCCIVALSLNLQKRTNPVIWFQEQLPFDCHTVIPIPMPVGGVLIIAANSIIYLKQTLPSCGLPLNCYALLSTDFPLRQEVPACGPLSLEGCCASLLNPTQVLISARGGTFYILTLWLEKATNTVTSLILSEAGTFTPAESITLMDDSLLFIGSSLSDSLLLRYRLTSEKLGLHPRPPGETLTNGTILPITGAATEPKRVRLDSTASFGSATDLPSTVAETDSSSAVKTPTNHLNFDETDVELYGPSIQHPTPQFMDIDVFKFEVLDCLRNIGPMANITAGEVPCLATGQTDPSDEVLTAAQAEMAHIELIASIARPLTSDTPHFQPANSAVGGGIALLHRSVRAHGLTAFELPEYNSLWSLYGPPVGTFGEKESVKEEEGEEEHEKENHSPVNGSVGNNEAFEDVPTKIDSPDPNAFSHEEKENKIDILATEIVGDTGPPKENSDATEVITESNGESTQQLPQEMEGEETMAATGKQPSTPLPPPASSAELHSYLLLTREDSTMILEVGEEIVELEVSGFNTTETTVIAANLGQIHSQRSKSPPLGSMDASPSVENAPGEPTSLRVGKDYPYILQVSPTSLRLLDGPRLLEHLPLTTEWRIYLASVTDPYVLVGTEDDDLILAALRDTPLLDETVAPRGVYQGSSLFHQAKDYGAMDYGQQAFSAAENLPFSRYLELSRPKVDQVSAPQCFCLYHDTSGRLARWLQFNSQTDASLLWLPNQSDSTKNSNVDVDGETQLSALDEEDILLYGEVISTVKKEKLPGSALVPQPASSSPLNQEESLPTMSNRSNPTDLYFAFIVFSNGVLEIYSVPDFTRLYEVQQFSGLPNMLWDSRWMTDDKQTTSKPSKIASLLPEVEDMPPTIREISVFPMGTERDRPVLLVRTTHEVVCYEALCPMPGEALPLTPGNPQVCGVSPLRWRRLPIACPLLAPRRLRTDPRITDLQAKLTAKMSMLRPFENIGGHRGVFVCGSQPMWLFATDRGHIRVFPHTIDGVMTSFAALNTATCPSGFVYFTHANEMRLATLPQGYSYEEELGIRSIQLDGRPHFVQYHLESKTYVVVSSHATEARTIFRLNAEGNKEEEEVKRPADCVYPLLDAYKLQVFSTVSSCPNSSPTWELVPNSLIEFEAFEVVTCLVTAQLASEQTIQGTKDYLALGSNLSYGEEIPVRGRILLIDIIEVVPEPGQPLTRHRVKTVFDGDQKGPVTALASCQGHLVSAVGQKIYIWTLKNGDLIGVAFVDTDLYIHSLLCVKNLVLAADVLKSIQLLRFQASMRVLSVVSRDTASREVFATNFFVDGSKLGFLITDKLGNLVVHSYDPMELASCSGRRLVPRADMRLPSRATTCLRVANRFRHPLLATHLLSAAADGASATDNAAAEKRSGGGTGQKAAKQPATAASGLFATFEAERSRHSVYLGTQSGAIYLVTPIRDKMLSRFRIVEKNLVQCVGTVAGLVPRFCRQYSQPYPELRNPCGNVADGDLIWRYLCLPHAQRLEVARKSGQSLDSILDDIAEVNAITLHF